jgi:hypothetical protein
MTIPVFADLETTGTDPARHRIFEIALIVDGEKHHWWLEPDLSTADPNALRVNRLYERAARVEGDREEPAYVAKQVARLTSGRQLCGFNPSFDAAFLTAFLAEHGLVPAWDYHMVALESVCAGWLLNKANHETDPEAAEELRAVATPPWTSAQLSLLVGVDKSQFESHTAMGDAMWAGAVYEALTTPIYEVTAAKPTSPKRKPATAATGPAEEKPVRVGGMVKPTPEPEPEPEPEPTEPAAVEPEPTRPLVPPGMPVPADNVFECRECGEEITRTQAITAWTRFREFLCRDDLTTWSPGKTK